MACGRGPCSDASGKIKSPSVELLCRGIKSMAVHLSTSDSQRFKQKTAAYSEKWLEGGGVRKTLGILAVKVR
jgi:hypothetical protein